MPIDIDRFEDPNELDDVPTSVRIVRFLVTHDARAFTRGELADAIGANAETVGTNLTRLKARGLVRHREPYWTLTDDRGQAIDYLRSRYDDASLTDLLGTVDWEDPTRRDVSSGEGGEDAERRATGTSPDDEYSATWTSHADQPNPPHRAAASAFFDRVHHRFDDEIVGLYLFGSVARATAVADSDVDVLAVISDDADYGTVDDQLLDIAYDVQLEHGVRIEVHSIAAGAFATRLDRGDPFIRTIVEEGETGV